MKEQEVFWFDMSETFTSDDLNESIALLNAQGKRVVNISFPESRISGTIMVCLLCEEA